MEGGVDWRHVMPTMRDGRRMYVCPYCDRGYGSLVSLKRHGVTLHDNAHVKMHSCTSCGNTYRWRNGLTNHRRRTGHT